MDYIQPESKSIKKDVEMMEEDVENNVKESILKNKYCNLRIQYPSIYRRIVEKQDLTNVYDVLDKMIDVINGDKTIKEVADYGLEQQRKEEEEKIDKKIKE